MNLAQFLRGIPMLSVVGGLVTGAIYVGGFVQQFKDTQSWQREYEKKIEKLENDVQVLQYRYTHP